MVSSDLVTSVTTTVVGSAEEMVSFEVDGSAEIEVEIADDVIWPEVVDSAKEEVVSLARVVSTVVVGSIGELVKVEAVPTVDLVLKSASTDDSTSVLEVVGKTQPDGQPVGTEPSLSSSGFLENGG